MYIPVQVSIENFGILGSVNLNLGELYGIVSVVGVNDDTPLANSNMSGKSTLLSSLTWCLYECDLVGTPVKQDAIRVTKPEASSCSVMWTFVDESGKQLTVTRSRKKSPRTGDPTVCATVLNGTNTLTGENAEMFITSQFGSKDLFLSAHVFGYKEGKTPFIDSSQSDKEQFFDMLVPSADLNMALAETKSRLIAEELHLRSLSKSYDVLSGRMSTLKAEIDRAKEALKHPTVDKNAILAAGSKASLTRNGFNSAVKAHAAACDAASSAKANLDAAEDKLTDLTTSKNGAIAERDSLSARLARVIDQVDTVCPTCGQNLTTDKSRATIVKSLQSKLDATASTILSLDTAVVNARSDVLTMKSAYDKASVDKSKARGAMDDARRESESASAEHKSLLAAESALRNVSEESVAHLEKKRKAVVAQMLSIEEEMKHIKLLIDDLRFWEVGYGRNGIRAYRIENVLPALNAVARDVCAMLYGDGSCLVYSTLGETKRGEVRDKLTVQLVPGSDTPSARLSGGQSMRRDIAHLIVSSVVACKMGLKRVSMCVFDEAFRSVDEHGTLAIIDAIRAFLSTDNRIVFVIDHNDELVTHCDHKIQVRRTNGVSSVSTDR